MPARWGICAVLALFLALMVGCRTPQPDLKPAKAQEALNAPPQGTYDTPGYPKQAYDKVPDPGRSAWDAKNNPDVMQSRGGGMPGGSGGGMGGLPGRP